MQAFETRLASQLSLPVQSGLPSAWVSQYEKLWQVWCAQARILSVYANAKHLPDKLHQLNRSHVINDCLLTWLAFALPEHMPIWQGQGQGLHWFSQAQRQSPLDLSHLNATAKASALPVALGKAWTINYAKTDKFQLLDAFAQAELAYERRFDGETRAFLASLDWAVSHGYPLPLLLHTILTGPKDNALNSSTLTPINWVLSAPEQWEAAGAELHNNLSQAKPVWCHIHPQAKPSWSSVFWAATYLHQQFGLSKSQLMIPYEQTTQHCMAYSPSGMTQKISTDELTQSLAQHFAKPQTVTTLATLNAEPKDTVGSLLGRGNQNFYSQLPKVLLEPSQSLPVVYFSKANVEHSALSLLTPHMHQKRLWNRFLDPITMMGVATAMGQSVYCPFVEILSESDFQSIWPMLSEQVALYPKAHQGNIGLPMVMRIMVNGLNQSELSSVLRQLRGLPGVMVASLSQPKQACLLYREAFYLAAHHHRCVCLLEPTSSSDELAPFPEGLAQLHLYPSDGEKLPFGSVTTHGHSRQVVIITHGEGVALAKRAQHAFANDYGIPIKLVDIAWVHPAPLATLREIIAKTDAALILEPGAKNGSVGEAIMASISEQRLNKRQVALMSLPDAALTPNEKKAYLSTEAIVAKLLQLANIPPILKSSVRVNKT